MNPKKICKIHGEVDTVKAGATTFRCAPCAREAVKRWRKNTKTKMIDLMGKACQICGYNKCPAALDFHHRDPSKKELSFAAIRASPKNWAAIERELAKCVLLCNRCHAEVHAGLHPGYIDE